MYCKKCGTAIAGDTQFCPICNHWIAEDDVEETDRRDKEQERKPFVFVPMKMKKVHKVPSVIKGVLSVGTLCLICGAFIWLGTGEEKEPVPSFADKRNTTADPFAVIGKAINMAAVEWNGTEAEQGTELPEEHAETDVTGGSDSGIAADSPTIDNPTTDNSLADNSAAGSGNSSGCRPSDEPQTDVILSGEEPVGLTIFSDMASFEREVWSIALNVNGTQRLDTAVCVSEELYNQIVANNNAINSNYGDSVELKVIDYTKLTRHYADDSISLRCSPALLEKGIAEGIIFPQNETIVWNTYPEPVEYHMTYYYVPREVYEQHKAQGDIVQTCLYPIAGFGDRVYSHPYQIRVCTRTEYWY